MRARGFTLLEMMIAVALTLALAGGVLAFLWNLERARGPVLAVGDRDRAVDEWLDRLESDLVGAVSATGHGPGIDARVDRIVIRTRGVGAGSDLKDRLADLRLSVHEFKGGAIGVGNSRDGSEPPPTREMVPGVEAVRFRFAHGAGWSDRYDSVEMNGLPPAVEVSLWLTLPGASATEHAGEETGIADDEEDRGGRLWPERAADRVRVIPIPDGGGGS